MSDLFLLEQSVRKGEWLEMPLSSFYAGTTGPPEGEHPYAIRNWLLSTGHFPEKWINRLYSVGGIRMHNKRIMLRLFAETDLTTHPLYTRAAASLNEPVPSVLFEDDHCLVLNKPAGMPVHPSSPEVSGTLDEAVVRHSLLSGQAVPIRHIHRLDDETSGPVLYAKNDLAQYRLDEDMRAKRISRLYVALVQGKLSNRKGTIDLPIGRDRHHPSRRRVSRTGDRAVTHYEVLETYTTASMVSIRLETGRTHQIRVHFSHLGHALIGDRLYGGDTSLLSHQALHGEKLSFRHPWHLRPVEIDAPRPEWFELTGKRLSARANS
ncbi:RluA family pseudouridine synthase [Paenibacillus tarimensis]